MVAPHDSLPVCDRAFLGEGLFETIRIKNSKPLFTQLHWQRLQAAAQLLGISFSLSAQDWHQQLVEKIHQQQMTDGGVKVILSGGIAARGLTAKGQNNQLVMQCFTYHPLQKPLYLVDAPWLRDANNPIYRLKTLNYLEAIIARRHAQDQGADDALFFNIHHRVAEATTANIFFIYQHCIYTPPITEGVLPGITRARLLTLCASLHIDYNEIIINRDLIEASESAFLTNSLSGIHYVAAINQRKFLVPHPLIAQLQNLLAKEEI